MTWSVVKIGTPAECEPLLPDESRGNYIDYFCLTEQAGTDSFQIYKVENERTFHVVERRDDGNGLTTFQNKDDALAYIERQADGYSHSGF